jgi:hypothetical protein
MDIELIRLGEPKIRLCYITKKSMAFDGNLRNQRFARKA